MTWAAWLAAPIGATVLAALWAWWGGWRARRAQRPLPTQRSVRAHERYLDALVIPARGTERPPQASSSDGTSEFVKVCTSTLPR